MLIENQVVAREEEITDLKPLTIFNSIKNKNWLKVVFIFIFFALFLLIMSSLMYDDWDKLSIPDNKGCKENIYNSYITHNVNKVSNTNYLYLLGEKEIIMTVDVHSQIKPFTCILEKSKDGKEWIDITESKYESKIGVKEISVYVPEEYEYVRIKILSPGSNVILNRFSLELKTDNQKEEKNTVSKSLLSMLVTSSLFIGLVLFTVLLISVDIRKLFIEVLKNTD